MSDFRYAQFCPVARACELLASRWTLLIVRDLLAAGELRFRDLQQGLPGISSSVLTERLAHLERNGIVARRTLAPPAASTVYALTETGQSLRPALLEFLRWGLRFMASSQPDDHFEPRWLPMGMEAIARRDALAPTRIALALRTEGEPLRLRLMAGPSGTQVEPGDGPADARLDSDPRAVLMLAAGALTLEQAEAAGLASASGDRSALGRLPELFEFPNPNPT